MFRKIFKKDEKDVKEHFSDTNNNTIYIIIIVVFAVIFISIIIYVLIIKNKLKENDNICSFKTTVGDCFPLDEYMLLE
jgi:hypothetical protein